MLLVMVVSGILCIKTQSLEVYSCHIPTSNLHRCQRGRVREKCWAFGCSSKGETPEDCASADIRFCPMHPRVTTRGPRWSGFWPTHPWVTTWVTRCWPTHPQVTTQPYPGGQLFAMQGSPDLRPMLMISRDLNQYLLLKGEITKDRAMT